MTPDEIEIIIQNLSKLTQAKEPDYSHFYVILSIIITSAVPLVRYIKKMFTKSIEKVVISHNENILKIVNNHFSIVKNLVDSYKNKMEELFRIMHLHIDELEGISEDVTNNKRRIKEIEKKIHE